MLLQKEKQANEQLKSEYDEVSAKQRVSEDKLKESQMMVSDLKTKLDATQMQIDTLNRNFEQEKSAKMQAMADIEQMRQDLEQQKAARTELERQFSQAKEEVRRVQAQLRQLDVQKGELEAKVKDLEEKAQSGVELGTIVVAPDQQTPGPAQVVQQKAPEPVKKQQKKTPAPAPAPKPAPVAAVSKDLLEGKVLVVNKEYNFLVIDLGKKDGIEPGMVFSVSHNNKYIGDVKVEKVHDAMSAAGFLTQGLRDKVSEGDKASSRRNK